jgi:hypothetical protein
MAAKTDVGQLTTPELIKSLVTDSRELLSKEVEAARIEVREDIAHAKAALAKGIAAGAMALCAAVALIFALALAIARYTTVPYWAALGGLGVVVGLGAIVFARSAQRDTREVTLLPERTVKELRGDARFIQRAVQ